MPAEEMHHGAQDSGRPDSERLNGDSPLGAKPETPYDKYVLGGEREAARVSPETQQAATEQLVVVVEALQAKNLEYENRITELEAALRRHTWEREEVQPRRVRHKDGVTEQLVKYKNDKHNTYWEPVDQKSEVDEITAGWNEFSRERDAGMFDHLGTGVRAEDAPTDSAAESSGEADEPVATTTTPAESEAPAEVTAEAESSSEEAEASDAAETQREASEASEQTETEGEAEPAAEASEQPTEESESTEETAEEESQEEAEKGLELKTSPELISLEARLERAVEDYAKLTAKNRGSHFGHFLQDSKVLAKFPPLKWLADKTNSFVDKKITASREEYEKAITDLQVAIGNALIEQHGESEEVVKAWTEKANKAAIDADLKLELKILAERMGQSKKTNNFINWWVSHNSLGAKFAKAGIVVGAALPIGIVAGLGGAPVLGLAVAGAGGAALGNYINKRRANAVDKADALGRTDAQLNSQEDMALKARNYAAQDEASISNGGVISASELTKLTEERTAQEKAQNRKRTGAITGAALAGAGVGTGIGTGIRAGIDGAVAGAEAGGADAANGAEGADGGENGGEGEDVETPAIQGNEFTVENGGSYTQELMDFAQANGHSLTPDQSYQLYTDLKNQFGGDFIDINGAGNDVYNEAGDFRLMEPGAANWADGVSEYIQQWMTSRGLW